MIKKIFKVTTGTGLEENLKIDNALLCERVRVQESINGFLEDRGETLPFTNLCKFQKPHIVNLLEIQFQNISNALRQKLLIVFNIMKFVVKFHGTKFCRQTYAIKFF